MHTVTAKTVNITAAVHGIHLLGMHIWKQLGNQEIADCLLKLCIRFCICLISNIKHLFGVEKL